MKAYKYLTPLPSPAGDMQTISPLKSRMVNRTSFKQENTLTATEIFGHEGIGNAIREILRVNRDTWGR